MAPLINELYELSDNTPLFTHLRTGGRLAALAEIPPPAAPKGRKPAMLAAVRAALAPALAANDRSALFGIISKSGTNVHVTILGELILALHALAEGQHAGEPVDELRETALQLALDVGGALEANPPQDANDEEWLIHGIAVREWAHLFADHYKALGVPAYEAELIMIRAGHESVADVVAAPGRRGNGRYRPRPGTARQVRPGDPVLPRRPPGLAVPAHAPQRVSAGRGHLGALLAPASV